MAYIHKKLKRLRLKQSASFDFPYIMVDDLPDGHMGCKCGCPYFHAVLSEEDRKIYLVCSNCESQITILFPKQTDLKNLGEGELHCDKHPKSHFIFIKCHEYCSVGCRNCDTEVNIRIWNDHIPEEGLVI